MDKDSLEIIKEIAKANAEALYEDAAKPSIRVIGKSLAQCVALFSRPIGRMAEILENNINRFLNKLEGVREEELISPDTRILVPILEKLRYTEDETVANYYAEILAAASKKETKGKVLLSFIEILNRVTSDELKTLEFINSPKNAIIFDATRITEEERQKDTLPNTSFILPFGTAVPVIDVKIKTEGRDGYQLVLNNFNLLPESVSLEFPENIELYIDNLLSLGLLHIPYGKSFAFKHAYMHLKEHKTVKEIEKNLQEKQKVSFTESRIELTNLSLRLLSMCARDTSKSDTKS